MAPLAAQELASQLDFHTSVARTCTGKVRNRYCNLTHRCITVSNELWLHFGPYMQLTLLKLQLEFCNTVL